MKHKSLIVVTVSLILGSAAAQAGTEFDQTIVMPSFRETSVVSCEAKLAAQEKKNAGLQCDLEYLECLEAGNDAADCKAAELLCKLKAAQAGQQQGGDASYTGSSDGDTIDTGDGTSGTFTVPAQITGDLIVGNFKLKPGKKAIESGDLWLDLDGKDGAAPIKADQIIRTVSCEARLKGAEDHFQSLQEKIEELQSSGEGR